MRVHNVTCGSAKKVAQGGGFTRHWLTRVGAFNCKRERNATDVLWVYTCTRFGGRQGVFFVPALASGPDSRWHLCAAGFDPQGNPSMTNNLWRRLRERQSNSVQARGVIQRQVKAAWQQSDHERSDVPPDISVGAFSCHLAFQEAGRNLYATVACFASGGRRVLFNGIS